VAKYRQSVASRSDRERVADAKEKTGVFTGAFAVNPLNDEQTPVWISDYVLMGYGTGAIMAVPAHDQRDYEFAVKFKLPIKTVVRPAQAQPPTGRAFEEEGIAVNSSLIDGMPTAAAKAHIIDCLEAEEVGVKAIRYKLRDWLFSRQRYWGEPFPILFDASGNAHAIPESELPLRLPEVDDFKPTGTPEPPLSKARQWVEVTRGQERFFRETNTMPQWAGSCWYYLRYLDPNNTEKLVDPAKEKYWMPVDLYVGGVEHAVLHLLYSRFWHKVLFDLGHVSTPEPFRRLVNQGLILGEMEYHVFTDDDKPVSLADLRDIEEEATPEGARLIGFYKSTGQKVNGDRVPEEQVEKHADGYRLKSDPSIRVDGRSFKMSKSRGNVVTPDAIVAEYGADTFRLYEMYMGPLETQKPWNTRDIVGMWRFLQSAWRILINEETGKPRLGDHPVTPELDRQMHRAIKKVGDDIGMLRFNTGIAELIELKNAMTQLTSVPRELAENFTLMLAPFAPHMAEEIWERLGHDQSLTRHPWPKLDESKLAETTIELPVQVNGKLRGKIAVAADAGEDAVFAAAEPAIQSWLTGKTVVKRIYVAGKLVSYVVK
jgi:leucyl-tRNA synthetase